MSYNDITKKGTFKIKVLKAHDSFKINPPTSENDGRKINMIIKITGASEENDDQVGRTAKSTIFLSAPDSFENPGETIFKSLRFLAGISGALMEDIPSKNLYEMPDGSYNMRALARDVHLNCSALEGREFMGTITSIKVLGQNTYANLSTHGIHPIPDEYQDQEAGNPDLWYGPDTASHDFYRIIFKEDPSENFARSFWAPNAMEEEAQELILENLAHDLMREEDIPY